MVDTKFLIVTTLCYVGIFIVVLAVCCCAWARYMKNEGRIPPNRRTKLSRGRRTARDGNNASIVSHSQPPPSRQYRYIGDFSELNSTYPHHIANYTHVQNNCRPAVHTTRPAYPTATNHYTLVEAYPPRNFYPASLATATDTYDIDLQMDINSAVFAETSQGGLSGDEFSDFQSSRYDSGHDVSGIISGDAAVLSCSDVGNSFKIAHNSHIERNGLPNGSQVSIESLKDEKFEVNYAREIVIDGQDSCENDSDCAMENMFVPKPDRCNGIRPIAPSCSAQSLTELNDQPEQIPLNSH